jgi:O-antigen ligase
MIRWRGATLGGPTRGMTAGVIIACVVASLVTSAIATSMDVLGLLLVALLAGAALAAAIVRPELLFYAYCVAIPFNFALPPGPAGTVARIAGLIFFLGYLVRRPGVLRLGAIPLPGWLFIAWTLASGLWAIDAGAAFSTWLSVAQLFAITVLIASVVASRPEVVGNALWCYTISATLTGVWGILSYLQGAASSFGRGTTFANQDPALFASLILPAAVFLMGEIQSRARGPLLRSAALIGLVICVAALAVSGTRSAWVGILVATAAWLLLQRERRQLIAVGALVLGVVILVVAVPGAEGFLLGRAGSSVSSGGSGRIDIWMVGISILASAPLLGVGFGNFPTAFTPYVISQATASLAGGALYAGRAPHNVLLGTAVETGLVGGSLLAAFLGSALVHSKGVRGNVIRATLISLYVQSMFLDILQQKQLWLFLALAFGLGAAQRLREMPATPITGLRFRHGRGTFAAGAGVGEVSVGDRGSLIRPKVPRLRG